MRSCRIWVDAVPKASSSLRIFFADLKPRKYPRFYSDSDHEYLGCSRGFKFLYSSSPIFLMTILNFEYNREWKLSFKFKQPMTN